MLSPTEKTLLTELLALSPVPEQTLSFNELMGFMFGLAITPVQVPTEEWMVAIFGDDDSGISATDQARSMSTVLGQVYSTFMARKEQGELHFPYQLETLDDRGLEEVLDWVSGFEEALALRPELWEPGHDDDIGPQKIEELYFSIMVIQGLVDPVEIIPFFEQLPVEAFAAAFDNFDPDDDNRELQIHAFLLATLPLAIKTLQQHGDDLAKKLPPEQRPRFTPIAESPAFPAPTLVTKTARKANIIEVDFSKKKKKDTQKTASAIYQLRIDLKRSKPPIWRRVQVPGHLTLADLHEIIQLSMGWFDAHLHQFVINNMRYGVITDEDWDFEPVKDEEEYTLQSLARSIQPYFDYTYDFGDDWEHRITVEKVLSAKEGKPYPVLLKGKRACPPENIGGIWGYQEFLEAYCDPEHDDHENMQEWAGPEFEPERFDIDDIDEINAEFEEIFS